MVHLTGGYEIGHSISEVDHIFRFSQIAIAKVCHEYKKSSKISNNTMPIKTVCGSTTNNGCHKSVNVIEVRLSRR